MEVTYGIWSLPLRALNDPTADIKIEFCYVTISQYHQPATWWQNNDIGLLLLVGQEYFLIRTDSLI